MKRVIIVGVVSVCLAFFSVLSVGCEDAGQNAGESVDDAVDDAGDAVEDTVDAVQDATD